MATNPSTAGDVRLGGVRFSVHDDGHPVADASCSLYRVPESPPAPTSRKVAPAASGSAPDVYVETGRTGADGQGEFSPQPGATYRVICHHGPKGETQTVTVDPGCTRDVCFDLELGVIATVKFLRDDCTLIECGQVHPGDIVELFVESDQYVQVQHPRGSRVASDKRLSRWTVPSRGRHELRYNLLLPFVARGNGAPLSGPDASRQGQESFEAVGTPPTVVAGNLGVALQRTATQPTEDTAFFRALLNSTEGLSFNNYLRYMDHLFCGEPIREDTMPAFERDRIKVKKDHFRDDLLPIRLLPFTDSDAYRVIKAATEAFVMINCGVLASPRPFDDRRDADYLRQRDLPVPLGGLEEVFTKQYLEPFLNGKGNKTLPYLAVIRSKLPDIGIKLGGLDATNNQAVSECHGILQDKLTNPCLLELIWSYWHEEGMLVQTMNAITRRFQNVRSHERDPLANLEIDPLRPLNNVLWGFVQDEQHRLSVVRRNYEYDHHYGLRLEGKAVQRMQTADSRSRFIEAFHTLLRLCAVFFKQDDDTTVKADAFPVLNALKEVHLILSQGAHNQFGDLPSTARIEMLMQQWMLARPEFREFLPTRIMTAYPEPWMDRVDAMKKLQGWTDTSVLHFRNLAIFGEQVLLTIRWGHWSDVQEPLQAFNWARLLRPQIQGYSHAYRAVTGVDLGTELSDTKVDATLPSVLLQRRLATQQRTA